MLNPEIISRKLLFITIGVSFFILIYLSILHIVHPPLAIHFCNSEDKINILIQTKELDVLINPVGEKQVLECLGKLIPFYDRKIEYVLSSNDTLITALSKRYVLSHTLDITSLKIGNIEVVVDSSVIVRNKNNTFEIFQKNLTKSQLRFLPFHNTIVANDANSAVKTNKKPLILKDGEMKMLRL
ncbi:MAG TPA: hypothetical protein PLS49_00610 [Candidatus Woesebacteria bacterium]|nr:hypothetical protein [Candidatus Woesebacteria bacterium]